MDLESSASSNSSHSPDITYNPSNASTEPSAKSDDSLNSEVILELLSRQRLSRMTWLDPGPSIEPNYQPPPVISPQNNSSPLYSFGVDWSALAKSTSTSKSTSISPTFLEIKSSDSCKIVEPEKRMTSPTRSPSPRDDDSGKSESSSPQPRPTPSTPKGSFSYVPGRGKDLTHFYA